MVVSVDVQRVSVAATQLSMRARVRVSWVGGWGWRGGGESVSGYLCVIMYVRPS